MKISYILLFVPIVILFIIDIFIGSKIYNNQCQQLSLQRTDESSPIKKRLFYGYIPFSEISPTGAANINIDWEAGKTDTLFIEEQSIVDDFISAGVVTNNKGSIDAGFKVMDWGFRHQNKDGSFYGKSDLFHSTSFFVESVARSLLLLQQSPYKMKYKDKINHYIPLVHKAALWMTGDKVWKRYFIGGDNLYTHRRYLVGSALGLTGRLTGDDKLIKYSYRSILDGLSKQLPNGSNPELKGNDSSYNMFSVYYAERWLTYFACYPLTPRVIDMINKAIIWEKTKILPTGELDTKGNTRTSGQEKQRDGSAKTADYGKVTRAIINWGIYTNDTDLVKLGERIYQYKYGFL